MTGVRDDNFDWCNSANVVVREQRAIAIYINDHQNPCVIIREKGDFSDDEDHYCTIPFEKAFAVAMRILELAGVEGAFVPGTEALDHALAGLDGGKHRDRTNAERQRRYRERKRNGDGRDVTRDGDRDTVTPERDTPLLLAAE